ncbi:jg8283 [Pararge aegeria aegeria]|uniref:Jg8283 protein n=1 Tax=Pararge aegeria aegeria TaxID=348720 RepID=A0A8S4RCJ2_9NEOP|nr:jg8283 [Pararge aegeria aegeria]
MKYSAADVRPAGGGPGAIAVGFFMHESSCDSERTSPISDSFLCLLETLGKLGPGARKACQKVLMSLPLTLELEVTLAKELVWPFKGAMLPAS